MPASLNEEVVVTANRTETRIGETAASIVALSKTEIETTAAPTIDDKLRQVAGFSLFRRTGSRYANPTAQGVSLRGVGASGASRSLVLFDGVPLNDVFGGWILWSRVAPICGRTHRSFARRRVESLRQRFSERRGQYFAAKKFGRVYNFGGNLRRNAEDFFRLRHFSVLQKIDWSADFSASHFQTKGYIPVDENERGAIDSFAGARNVNFSARIARNFGENTNLFFKTSYFGESRTNGTPAQINRTHLREFVFGGNSVDPNFKSKIPNLNFDWRIFGGTQVYDQTFSAVSADRNSESLTRLQRVPAQNLGFSGQVSGVVLKNQTFVFGVEAREVRGASDEIGFFNNRATSVSGAGGRERTFGIFFQDFAQNRLEICSWREVCDLTIGKTFRALNSVRTLSNNQTSTISFPDRNENAFSPQISALYQINENFSVFALASKSFRAPTLNELYRGFRVGNVVTNANENLKAETAANFETGASFNKNNFYLRGSFFYTAIENPVANVTLTVTPNLITRQRQNAGQTRAQGIEIEAEQRFREFKFSVGYLLTDSRVTKFPVKSRFGKSIYSASCAASIYISDKLYTLELHARLSRSRFVSAV